MQPANEEGEKVILRELLRPIALTGLLILGACGESPTPIIGCEASAGIQPDCRFQNPEDLAVLPSNQGLLVSQFGGMDGAVAGNLVFYSPRDGRIEVLFPPTGAIIDDRSWGSAACEPPDAAAFAPHGIDLEQRADGRHVLLVVNHGLRESVEMLEVLEDAAGVTLEWRGCAEGPDQSFFNDVVASRDGGFWVTHMMPQDAQTSAMLKSALFGADSGFVYAWNQKRGFTMVAGSNGPFPNGIEKSADESHLFINMYIAGEVRKLNLATATVVAVADVASPDNVTWSTDGRLLVASHTDGFLELTACQGLEQGSCGFAFEIVALDPATMTGVAVVANRGAPMGAATVAVEYDGELYLGTFAGDRIARTSWNR